MTRRTQPRRDVAARKVAVAGLALLMAGCGASATTSHRHDGGGQDPSGGATVAVLTDAPATLTRRVHVADPTGLVQPSCSRPPTPIAAVAMSRAADEAVPPSGPQQQLQPGTDHSVAASQWAYPAAQVHDWLTHEQSPPAHKLAFLTFDDGPSGVTTPQVLKVLQAEQVHATFFEITRQIGDFDANLVREQIATGNAVEIHSYSHNYHYLFPHRVADAAHVSCDLDWSQAVMKSVLGDGYQAHALRYPGGHMSWRGMAPADAVLADRGIAWVDWDALSGDADATLAHHTADDLTRNVQTTAARNAPGQPLVILSHDFYPNHVEVASLTAQIDNLKAQGYSFGIIN